MTAAVRVAIDQNTSSGSLLAEGDVDTLQLNEVIREKLCDAARQVIMEAPVNLLECGHSTSQPTHSFADAAIRWDAAGRKGWLILNDDFLRLVTFKMSDWRRAVYLPINESDPRYLVQWSDRRGLCGNVNRPVVAIVMRAEGKVLEFFSCNSKDAKIDQAVYVPIPVIDSSNGIDIPELCYRAAVYRAAGLVLSTFGDQNAASLVDISRGLLV